MGSQDSLRAVSLAMTGPPSISATPVVSEFSIKRFQIGVDHDLSWSRTVLITGGGTEFDQTVGHPLRIRIEQSRFWIHRYFVRFLSDRRFHQRHLHPGQISVQIASDPVQGVLDRQPAHPAMNSTASSEVGRVGSPGGTIQGRIRQTQTLGNHRFLGLRSGQLRNRIDLIQLNSPAANRERKTGRSSSLSGHPNQLGCSRMTQTKPGRNPLRKIARPVRQEPLTPIRLHQIHSQSRRANAAAQRTENDQYPHRPDHSKTLPLHSPNVRDRCDRNGSETGIEGKSRNFYRPYRPFHSGSRFSRKASNPSAASSVPRATD